MDAINLKQYIEATELTLTDDQKAAIREGLPDVVTYGATVEEEWETLLIN